MSRIWRAVLLLRRTSFSVRFAAVILVAGLLLAGVPLLLAQTDTRAQALERAADKAGVAANLFEAQRESLQVFAGGIARQLQQTGGGMQPSVVRATLLQDAQINRSDDLIAFVPTAEPVVAVRGAGATAPSSALLTSLLAPARRGDRAAPDAEGSPWLLATAPVAHSDAMIVIARPVDAAVVARIGSYLETNADDANLAVIAGLRYGVDGSIGGTPVHAGAPVDPAIARQAAAGPATLDVAGRQTATATASLGGGFTLLVTTPVQALSFGWQPVMLLVALILAAMLVIVVVVQTSLQRPLRRLDRAVAAVARGEFDVPVPTNVEGELGRLAATFEEMRSQLHATMQVTGARAAVATQLGASQPLEQSLHNVCSEVRRAIGADATFIVVSASEMADPFTVVDGVERRELDRLLAGDGPLGEAYRLKTTPALVAGATAASREARLGVREFCAAPLRVGGHVHGVIAAANANGGFRAMDMELIGASAEQVALALERYRVLAVVQRQASMDDLTGLYNHRFLVDYLGQQVALAERLAAPLAILMLDLDHFKVLNDTHGHQAGDTALAAFAQTLLTSVRRSDLAARYGGEEFSVVMANTRAADARLVAEKIRAAVAGVTIELPDGTRLGLTVSIGGAAYPEDTDDAGGLLALADEALYRAKRGGRDRSCMAGDARKRRSGQRAGAALLHTPPEVVEHSDAVGSHRSPQ